MAASAPSASVGLTIAGLAAATAYGSGPVIILTAIPMLIIANAYRRLNMWNANAGASFEWVGRAINPYLGFQTGWLMVAAYILGTISGVEILAPTVLAAFGSNSSSTWANIGIDTALALVVLVIAVVGIKITARTQLGMALVEYAILIGFGITGLVVVLGHHHGTYAMTSGWLSPFGVGGHGSAAAGFLIAVFMFTGWDGAIYVNEETTRRRINPGKAVLIAVALLAVIYTLATVGLQGVVSPARLQANAASALVYIAQSLGGGGWGKVMALSVALSAIASTGAGIVITARRPWPRTRCAVCAAAAGMSRSACWEPYRWSSDGPGHRARTRDLRLARHGRPRLPRHDGPGRRRDAGAWPAGGGRYRARGHGPGAGRDVRGQCRGRDDGRQAPAGYLLFPQFKGGRTLIASNPCDMRYPFIRYRAGRLFPSK